MPRAKLLAKKQSRGAARVDPFERKVVKKRSFSMTLPKSLASPSLPLSEFSSWSLVETLDANNWSSSDLRALMDPLEVAIGATMPFKDDNTHPSVHYAPSVATNEVNIDCLGNPASGAPDVCLEGEGVRLHPLWNLTFI